MSTRIVQIMPPDLDELQWDDHPRLTVDGYGIHCGQVFQALLPDGWTRISIELGADSLGFNGWYIPRFRNICPVGLFVKVDW